MDDILQKKFTDAMSAFAEHKETVEKKLTKLDSLDLAKLDKTEKAIGDAVEAAQELKGKQMALEAKQAQLEATLSRPEFAGKSKDEVEEKKAAYSAAFNEFFKKGGKEDFVDFLERKGDKAEYKDLRVGTDTDGGFLVTPVISDLIVTRQFETSPVRQVASQITIGTDSYEVLTDYDQATSGGWVSETGSRSVTNTPNIGKIIIPVHEQFAQPRATQKLLDDAKIDAEGWISGKINDIITRTENAAFVNGDGSGKPQGFLSYAAWASAGVYENNKIEQINSGTSGGLTYDGLVNLQNGLLEVYQPNAVFMMKRATYGLAQKLVDGEGRPIFNLMYDKNAGVTASILGKQVVFADALEAAGSNSLSIAYGDFRAGYQIVDRAGVRILRDPYTAKPYVLFYATKRTGGAVINFEAIKIQKLA